MRSPALLVPAVLLAWSCGSVDVGDLPVDDGIPDESAQDAGDARDAAVVEDDAGPDIEEPADAGPDRPDASAGRDAGHAPDAGPRQDAGHPADAGHAADAGARPDAGHAPDAGHRPDAGPPADAGPQPEPWSFVVMGDNQFSTSSCTSGVQERLAVPAEIVEAAPDFVVHVGDLMDHGYEAGAYAKFKSCYSAMLADAPFFPVAGNHDLGSGGAVLFRSYLEEALQTTNPHVYGRAAWNRDFDVVYGDDPTAYSTNPSSPSHRPDLPSGFSFKTFYAFRFRNAYFVGLESGTQWWTNTPVSWLDRHLAAADADPTIEHVFVWMHHPIYSSTMPDADSSQDSLQFVRNAYEATLRRHAVTAVFSGHVHLYDRFLVPDDGHSTRTSSPPARYSRSEAAIHYITTGGAGGPLPNGCNPTPGERRETSWHFQQKRACGYHFMRVEVEGTRLTFDTWRVTGSATSHSTQSWDHFTIE